MDAVAKAELRERCAANDIKPLDDLYDIEYTAMTIKDLTHKIDIQKGYKKSKTQAINDEMARTSSKLRN